MPPQMPKATRFGCDPAATTPTEQYEFTAPTLRFNEQILEALGFRGTRDAYAERVRQGTRAPGYALTLAPNSVELDLWLPRILGGAEVTDNFPLAETVPTFVSTFDLGVTRLSLTGCKVNRATFRAAQGAILEMLLDVEAVDSSLSATAFPALAVSPVGPYVFSDSTSGLTVNALTTGFHEWSLEVSNDLDVGRFLNSQIRTALPERDRVISWTWAGPYGDNNTLFGLAPSGVVSTAVFTQGTRSLSFSSPNVAYPREFPEYNAMDELRLPLRGRARRTAAAPAITVTNDST